MNEQNCQEEIDWLAFCYTAGELDVAAAEAFEARLADDQTAREALARAVELTQIVAAAEAGCGDFVVPAGRVQADWNSRLSWMAVGGLASLLLALLWSGVIGPTYNMAQRRLNASSRQDLALAWNQTRTEFTNIREVGWWPATLSDTDEDNAASDARMDETAVEDAPSWMTAAVFSLPGSADGVDSSTQPTSSPRLEN